MSPMDPTGEHFAYAEKLRELRLKLAKTDDEAQRHIVQKQIEQLEDELKPAIRR